MKIIIREANLDSDREILIETLRINRPRISDDYPYEKRYEWLYEKNPHGKAKAWLAIDEDNGEVAGFTVALPREMVVFGNRINCWNCADFSINKKYRTLGIAIKLRKAAKEQVENGAMSFLYAHPNNDMVVVHQKVGHVVIGNMVRYAKILNLNLKTKKTFGENIISNVLAKIGNPLLKISAKEYLNRAKYEVEILQNNHYSDEFSDFFEEACSQYAVVGIRNKEYLNWRYFENPLYNVETLVLRNNEKILGYIIYLIKNNIAHIKDLFCINNNKINECLLTSCLVVLRKYKVSSVSFGLLDSNPFINILKRFGFKYRPDSISSVVIYPNSSFQYADELLNKNNWFMTVGDRDV